MAKVDLDTIKEAYMERSRAIAEKIGKEEAHIMLYLNGHASCGLLKRHKDRVIFDIPIPNYYNSRKARLLFCYDSGHVNSMFPREVLLEKLRSKTRVNRRGYRDDGLRTLMRVFVCHKDDILIAFSRDAEGKRYIKAGIIKRLIERANMNAFGDLFIEGARPYRWLVVPRVLVDAINPIRGRSYMPLGLPLEEYPFYKKLLALDDFADRLSPCPIVKR